MTYKSPLLLLTHDQVHNDPLRNKLIYTALSLTSSNASLSILIEFTPSDLNSLILYLAKVYETARFHNKSNINVTCFYQSPVHTNAHDVVFAHQCKPDFTPQKLLDFSETTLQDTACNLWKPEPTPEATTTPAAYKQYNTVAVGGTFDHLHDGHKILLTASVFLSKKHLIIGVTGQELLKNKKYPEFLENFDLRAQKVSQFVSLIDPNLDFKIHEINDVCGPTAYVKDIDALVLSSESVNGGEYVNRVRKEKGFLELIVHEIVVLGGSSKDGFKDKLSSTELRKLEYERSISQREKTNE